MKYKLDLGSPTNKEAKHIIFIVSKAAGINVQFLKSKARFRSLVDVRRICYILLKNDLNLTFGEIGAHFNRDHVTVIHHYSQHEDLLRMYADYRILWERVQGRLNNNPYVENDFFEIIDNLSIRLNHVEKLLKEKEL